jgi:hypothetical protein
MTLCTFADGELYFHQWRRSMDSAAAGALVGLVHILLRALKGIIADVHPSLERAIDIGDGQHYERHQKRAGKHLQ